MSYLFTPKQYFKLPANTFLLFATVIKCIAYTIFNLYNDCWSLSNSCFLSHFMWVRIVALVTLIYRHLPLNICVFFILLPFINLEVTIFVVVQHYLIVVSIAAHEFWQFLNFLVFLLHNVIFACGVPLVTLSVGWQQYFYFFSLAADCPASLFSLSPADFICWTFSKDNFQWSPGLLCFFMTSR